MKNFLISLLLLTSSLFAQSVSINGVPNQTLVGPSGTPQYIAPQAIAGCGVEYVTGLTYTVGACNYSINGVTYNSPLSNITLPAADATNPEIDVIYVDTTGVVQVIQGTPAVTPQQPVVDPSTQLQLTFVLVPATATTPANTTSVLIYDEGTEWTAAKGGTSSANVNLTSTNNPYHGTHDTEFGAVGTVATTTYAQYTKPSAGTVTLGNYNTLTLYVRNKAAWPKTRSVTVQWYNGTTPLGTAVVLSNGAYGFDATGNITSYQQIAIPASTFGINGTAATTVRFTVSGSGSNLTGFYLDEVSLQGGNGGVILPTTLMNYRGAWSATATYAPNDTVVSGGLGYVAIAANTNQAVTNTAYWTPLASGGGGSFPSTNGIVFNTSTTASRVATGDTDYQSILSTPSASSIHPLAVQANSVFDQNCNNRFTDGTPYCVAGAVYSSLGEYIADQTLACQSNPGKCSVALLLNTLNKWEANWSNTFGYPLRIDASGAGATFFSPYDSYQHTATGDGRIFVPQALYLYCQKVGIGSSACTTEYTAIVAHIKAAWALVPRDGTTHLYQVVPGAEYVCGFGFQEQMRNTGLVANCNVWAAIDDADMLALATAANDATNVTFFTTDLSQLVTGIRANLIDGTSGLLKAATTQNSTNLDVVSSSLAVACDSSPVMAPCGALTSGQKTTIAGYFNTNYSTLVNANGFVVQTPLSGGWATVGCIPVGGGPPYTTSGICGFTGTQYQGGYWSVHAGWFATALGLANQTQVGTLLSTFLNGVDPGCEYFNQGSSTCTGTSPNLESPQWAVATNIAYPVAPAYTGGTGCFNKYGALTTATFCGSGSGLIYGTNNITTGATPVIFTGSTTNNQLLKLTSANIANTVAFLENTSTGGKNWGLVSAGSSGGGGGAAGTLSLFDATDNLYMFLLTNTGMTVNGDTTITGTSSVTGTAKSASLITTGGGTPWASTAFSGAMDTNNGTADGGPWRGYYAANHNLAFNVSNFGAPGTCGTTEIFRFVKDDGETGGAVIGAIDLNGQLCGWNGINLPSGTVYKWNSDTGLSRDSAGVVDVGNGTAGNASGTLKATTGTFSGAVTGTTLTPAYNNSGTLQSTAHQVFGSGTLSSGTLTVTLSGSAVYTSSSTYSCSANDSTSAAAIEVTYASGASVTFTGTGTDTFRYQCVGN